MNCPSKALTLTNSMGASDNSYCDCVFEFFVLNIRFWRKTFFLVRMRRTEKSFRSRSRSHSILWVACRHEAIMLKGEKNLTNRLAYIANRKDTAPIAFRVACRAGVLWETDACSRFNVRNGPPFWKHTTGRGLGKGMREGAENFPTTISYYPPLTECNFFDSLQASVTLAIQDVVL